MYRSFILMIVGVLIVALTSCHSVEATPVVDVRPPDGEVYHVPYDGRGNVNVSVSISNVENYFAVVKLIGNVRNEESTDTVLESGFYRSLMNFSEAYKLPWGSYTLKVIVRTPSMYHEAETRFVVNSSPKIYGIHVYADGVEVEGENVDYKPGLELKFKWTSADVDGYIIRRKFHILVDGKPLYENLSTDEFVWKVPNPCTVMWWIEVEDDRGKSVTSEQRFLYIY